MIGASDLKRAPAKTGVYRQSERMWHVITISDGGAQRRFSHAPPKWEVTSEEPLTSLRSMLGRTDIAGGTQRKMGGDL